MTRSCDYLLFGWSVTNEAILCHLALVSSHSRASSEYKRRNEDSGTAKNKTRLVVSAGVNDPGTATKLRAKMPMSSFRGFPSQCTCMTARLQQALSSRLGVSTVSLQQPWQLLQACKLQVCIAAAARRRLLCWLSVFCLFFPFFFFWRIPQLSQTAWPVPDREDQTSELLRERLRSVLYLTGSSHAMHCRNGLTALPGRLRSKLSYSIAFKFSTLLHEDTLPCHVSWVTAPQFGKILFPQILSQLQPLRNLQ